MGEAKQRRKAQSMLMVDPQMAMERLAELRGFAGSEGSKSLILLDRTSKGLHYRSAGDHGSSAVIFGGGCAGNSSLSSPSSSRWSGPGSV